MVYKCDLVIFLYDMIFHDVKILLEDNRIKIETIRETFMLEFVKEILNSEKKILKNQQLKGPLSTC